jgi:hypothetical protein
MSLPELPHNSSRTEMRKALIRLRMEMHRQEIRHEKPARWLRHQARPALGHGRRDAARFSDR